ncbi:sulfotransferase family protein [Truepera radiovictrix]|nr:sulfotransferase [Truepera radiovictrix]WMT58520.1 sulfotransferase [Truepera radiovictrix]
MKSGTSSLYIYLKQHPEIYLADIKEPHFFAFDPSPRASLEAAPGYRQKAKYMVTDRSAYEALFTAATPSQARGEASAMYLYYPGTAERIRAALPEVQLIAILRNPIERAYSAFLHQLREGNETLTDFGAALQLEEERIAQDYMPMWHYTRAGFYFEQLSRYYAVFDPSQIHVYLYEDLQRDPLALVQELYRVIGVDPGFVPDTTKQYNRSGVPKNRLLHRVHRFLKGNHPIKTVGKRLLPLPAAVRSRFKLNLIAQIEAANLKKPPLDPAVRAQLVERYRSDVLELQDLIGRDLSHWLT